MVSPQFLSYKFCKRCSLRNMKRAIIYIYIINIYSSWNWSGNFWQSICEAVIFDLSPDPDPWSIRAARSLHKRTPLQSLAFFLGHVASQRWQALQHWTVVAVQPMAFRCAFNSILATPDPRHEDLVEPKQLSKPRVKLGAGALGLLYDKPTFFHKRVDRQEANPSC